jgi:addiction module RelE/StbE family toxin
MLFNCGNALKGVIDFFLEAGDILQRRGVGDHRGARCATRSSDRQRSRTSVCSLSERMKLRYERGALADLDEIFAYIVADNREAAGHLVTRIEEAAARIAASPLIGHATRKSRFLRFPIGKYLIVYEIESDEVVVLYVRHSARPRTWEGE